MVSIMEQSTRIYEIFTSVKAVPMKCGEYNNARGFPPGLMEDQDADGYAIQLENNSFQWMSKAKFEGSSRLVA